MNCTANCKCPIIAAFDFDGTLTYRDSLLPFLIYTHGLIPAVGKLMRQLPLFISYLMGKASRQMAKEAVLTQFYGGMPLNELRKKGEAFAGKALDTHVKPEARERLSWHLEQGHRCVLISASIDIYLDPWAKKMGFHDLISSRLQTDAQGKVSGQLSGLNCWGPEKVRRLQELLGPKDNFILYAYGDSRGDQELLAMADYPFFKEMPTKGRPA